MNKLMILLLFLSIYITSLSAYMDTDLDGVSDIRDRCPNTLITDLVDTDGCTIKSLKSPHHLDFITGITYNSIDDNDTQNTTNINLQLDYYYKDYSLQLITTYQDTTQTINDLYLSGFDTFTPTPNLQVRVGFGAILPLQNVENTQNNTDYMANLNLTYSLKKYKLFLGYNYTNINDTNDNYIYQDISSLNLGAGFYINDNLYTSLAYTNTQSIIEGADNIENISLYLFYSINENYFTTVGYDYYIDNNINSFSLKIGYYF